MQLARSTHRLDVVPIEDSVLHVEVQHIETGVTCHFGKSRHGKGEGYAVNF